MQNVRSDRLQGLAVNRWGGGDWWQRFVPLKLLNWRKFIVHTNINIVVSSFRINNEL